MPRDGRDSAPVTRLHVNGTSYDVATHPSAALLWALHDEIGCSSVKYGCGSEQCGACRVLIDGAPAYSCTVTIADAEGRDAGQCGYCLPGIVLARQQVRLAA
jgi:nicotinate dehydrogenase subunit A